MNFAFLRENHFENDFATFFIVSVIYLVVANMLICLRFIDQRIKVAQTVRHTVLSLKLHFDV